MVGATLNEEGFLVDTKNTVTSTQPTYLPFDVSVSIRDLHQKKFVQFLFGSCHDSDATWQEIGRVRGSACSCPRPGSRLIMTNAFTIMSNRHKVRNKWPMGASCLLPVVFHI